MNNYFLYPLSLFFFLTILFFGGLKLQKHIETNVCDAWPNPFGLGKPLCEPKKKKNPRSDMTKCFPSWHLQADVQRAWLTAAQPLNKKRKSLFFTQWKLVRGKHFCAPEVFMDPMTWKSTQLSQSLKLHPKKQRWVQRHPNTVEMK